MQQTAVLRPDQGGVCSSGGLDLLPPGGLILRNRQGVLQAHGPLPLVAHDSPLTAVLLRVLPGRQVRRSLNMGETGREGRTHTRMDTLVQWIMGGSLASMVISAGRHNGDPPGGVHIALVRRPPAACAQSSPAKHSGVVRISRSSVPFGDRWTQVQICALSLPARGTTSLPDRASELLGMRDREIAHVDGAHLRALPPDTRGGGPPGASGPRMHNSPG